MHAAMLIVLMAAGGEPQPVVQLPSEGAVLRTLRAEHPRLIALPEDQQRVERLIEDDAGAAGVYEQLKRRAESYLSAAPIEHKLIGPRLLSQSRRCVDRVYTLSTIYRLTGDERFARRAVREMQVAAGFPDWNPSHFLDTAEMTHALAVGYDWLYDFLSPGERQTIRGAIVEKGLRQAEPFYREQRWWTRSRHNWNQVCNGGIALGALAVAEDEPELAAYIVHQAVQSVELPMAEFAPDGAWAEGPGYWNYATRYNVYMLAGLETALGTDFGLSRFPGFDRTGEFRIHFTGPTRRTFNFADGHAGLGEAAQMFYFARKFDRPLFAWHEREHVGGDSAWHLWWYDPRGREPDASFAPCRHFRDVDVVFLRSAWSDPDAFFVGFKGGSNRVNHSHLELGMFVLDALGQRWVLDLGSDNYNLPGYFGNKRWTYYRLATKGQNTLLLDGKNQDPGAAAPIVAFHTGAGRAHAVADLSAAYAGQAEGVQRGIALIGPRRVLVQDEIKGVRAEQIQWQVHTRAKIETDGARATLRQGGRTLYARILQPRGAVFGVESANPPRPEGQQPDVRKLVVQLTGPADAIRLAVVFEPDSPESEPAAELQPLAEWEGRLKPAPK